MRKKLYFICPTDHLEMEIDRITRVENFYFSSLANSIYLDQETVGQLSDLIETHQIQEINLVLSDENLFWKDDLSFLEATKTKGIIEASKQTKSKRKELRKHFEAEHLNDIVLKHFLKAKQKEMQSRLPKWISASLIFKSFLYVKQKRSLERIRFDRLELLKFSLN
ncbi:MAG: hypothetical protein AAF487_02050 [Bacteroidota bacterium]